MANQTGTVKWFNESKGFGFITPDGGGEDLFAHFSEIQGSGFKTLAENQRVEFEVTQGRKGQQASRIRPIYGPDRRRAPRGPGTSGKRAVASRAFFHLRPYSFGPFPCPLRLAAASAARLATQALAACSAFTAPWTSTMIASTHFAGRSDRARTVYCKVLAQSSRLFTFRLLNWSR